MIRLFVPSLEIKITEAKVDSGGIVRGKVSYTLPSLEDEYFGLFDADDLYDGPVTLFVNGLDTKIQALAKKNNFEFKLDNKIKNLKKEDVAVAKIEFGGIGLKSDETKFGGSYNLEFIQMRKYLSVFFDALAIWSNGETHYIFEGDGSGFKIDNYDYYGNKFIAINWNGGKFSITRHYDNPVEYGAFSYDYTITGTMRDDGSIAEMTYDYMDTSGWKYHFKVEDVNGTTVYRNDTNPELGSATISMDLYQSSVNGVLKEITAEEPSNGTAITFEPNTFQLYITFGDSY